MLRHVRWPTVPSFLFGFTLFLSQSAGSTEPRSDTCILECGDINASGSVTSADLICVSKFVSYAYLDCGGEILCSDIDGHAGLNLHDVECLIHYLWHDGPAPQCPPGLPEYIPQPSQDYAVRLSAVCPAGSSTVRIYPEFRASRPHHSFAADFYIDVEGEVPFVADWRGGAPEEAGWVWQYIRDPFWGSDTVGIVMLAFYNFSSSMSPAATHPLGWFDLDVAPASYPRQINYRLEGYPGTHNRAMMVDSNLVGWDVHLEPYLVRVSGDNNADDEITSADVIHLVNYVFKGGSPPYPFAAVGDANCSGDVTSTDIIRMVNHVFKSGDPPCDVEAECSFPDLVDWNCP